MATPGTPVAIRNEIFTLFNYKSYVSLLVVATGTELEPATVWNNLRKELKNFPYKLQMTPCYLKIMSQVDYNSLELVTQSLKIIATV